MVFMETEGQIKPGSGGPTMSRSIKDAKAYHRWVYSSFEKWLHHGGATLEIGAGHGEYSRMLTELGGELTVTDIDPTAVDTIRKMFEGKENVSVVLMDGLESGRLGEVFSNAVAVNIMEHIEDDSAFASSMYDVLKPGGRAVVFVPAFPFLYSSMDAEAGHYRRYTARGLRLLLENAGFSILNLRYFNFVGFFGWYVNKLTRSGVDSDATSAQVRLFNALAPLLKMFEIFRWLCGQSLVAVAEKPQTR